MLTIKEQDVENKAIDFFKSIGYSYRPGSDLFEANPTSLRTSSSEAVLFPILEATLIKVNPTSAHAAIQEAISLIRKSHSPNLFEQNKTLYNWIKNGIPVEFSYQGSIQKDHINLIDFQNPENNDWLIVSQFSIKTTGKPRRADLLVFVNGLCLSLFEFKNPADAETDIWEAYDQVETYKKDVPELFAFNILNVISDGIDTKYGSLFSPKERFLEWKTIDSDTVNPLGDNSVHLLETTIRGLFDKKRFLNFIQNFIVFESSKHGNTKKVAGYHQFNAVNAALSQILDAHAQSESPRKGGVTWHTQGAGKSIEMLCLVGKIQKNVALKNPTVVVVTDRNDLDDQLYDTFAESNYMVAGSVEKIESRASLRTKLTEIKAGGLYFTTIQKFEPGQDNDTYPLLTDRANVIVIVDEAHRSQYGFKGTLEKNRTKFGYAKYLRDALPGAVYCAFSGTPLEEADKDTTAVFGGYTHIYDMVQATKDGATVPIYYQQCKIPLDIPDIKAKELDESVDALITLEEDEIQGELKSKWASLANIVCADSRIEKLVKHLLEHFKARLEILDGKAMIVCISREECLKVYNEIIKINPTWHHTDSAKGVVKIIMTGSASDPAEFQPHLYSKQEKRAIAARLKNPDDELKLVIVRDMWLTGFDAPCLHTMYIDKPMHGHSLMQAIARINRVFKDKPGGLVVDYIGIGSDLKKAILQYSSSSEVPEIAQAISVAEALFKDDLKLIQGMLHGFDYSSYRTKGYALLPYAMDHILTKKEGKKNFCNLVTRLEKAYCICKTSPSIYGYAHEFAFLSAVKAALQKQGASSKKLSIINNDVVIKSLISNALAEDSEIIDILQETEKVSSDIGLLSEDFLKKIQELETKNLAVELLNKLLLNLIKSKLHTNNFQNMRFSELLASILEDYNLRHIDTESAIGKLIGTIKDCQIIANRGTSLGLTKEELCIFDVLNSEMAVFNLAEKDRIELSKSTWRDAQKRMVTDWQLRASAVASVRLAIRKAIRRGSSLDNEKLEHITDSVCNQLEYF